ncbi:hypothetical protein LZ30DRAFT_107499 [Colletotrichum cereale]|nr:hypothetical protein LZ30DRAFT_107499 [Colletotrichum cereale]
MTVFPRCGFVDVFVSYPGLAPASDGETKSLVCYARQVRCVVSRYLDQVVSLSDGFRWHHSQLPALHLSPSHHILLLGEPVGGSPLSGTKSFRVSPTWESGCPACSRADLDHVCIGSFYQSSLRVRSISNCMLMESKYIIYMICLFSKLNRFAENKTEEMRGAYLSSHRYGRVVAYAATCTLGHAAHCLLPPRLRAEGA